MSKPQFKTMFLGASSVEFWARSESSTQENFMSDESIAVKLKKKKKIMIVTLG